MLFIGSNKLYKEKEDARITLKKKKRKAKIDHEKGDKKLLKSKTANLDENIDNSNKKIDEIGQGIKHSFFNFLN